MENPSYVSLSGQIALARKLELVANNVANMNTTAFKKELMVFSEKPERLDVVGRRVSFVEDRATYTDMTEGSFEPTGNPLDMAIKGDGWFRVRTAEGERYTRDGRFLRDANGTLVTVNGHSVLGEGGDEIVLPENVTDVAVSNDGTISVDGGEAIIGRIGLFSFAPGSAPPTRRADGLYVYEGEAAPAENVVVAQGMTEKSNVNSIVEMTNLVELQRAYDRANRLIESEHSRISKMIDAIGRPIS